MSPVTLARLNTGLVTLLLLTLAALLAYSATQHSPTDLEPAFLVSGISHWEFGRFEAYRVNPPLVRMVAALPVIATGYQSDWSNFYEGPGARAEFTMGEVFLRVNGKEVIPLFFYARWACIPFSLIGAYFAYRWARDLYGPISGLVTLILYVFEPNLLAHGELITPDAACTAFGIVAGYTYWKWLQRPAWDRAALAGAALGLAILTKMSWLILFGLWPLLWLVWRLTKSGTNSAPSIIQLLTTLVLGVYLINLGYGFDETGTPLKKFRFVSSTLSGQKEPGVAGNRFANSWLGNIPIPVPAQFVLGFDLQKKDFEKYRRPSYLCGEWRDHGWWYYYLYGLLVKVPCGIWAILAIVVLSRVFSYSKPSLQTFNKTPLSNDSFAEFPRLRDELILLAPAIGLLALVSSQTEFSIHLRYAFPALGLGLVYLGQAGRYLNSSSPIRTAAICLSLCYAVSSSLMTYPNHLAYFNDFVGGPKHGHEHLLGSSLDWGQGTLQAMEWIHRNRPNSTVEFRMRFSKIAEILHSQSTQVQPDASHPAIPAVTEVQSLPERLILYSADYYSQRHSELAPNMTKQLEGETIRFPGGRVLVQLIPAP